MAGPDAKKLAAAINRARGKKTHDKLIIDTFEELPTTPAGHEVAWKILELADERACVAGPMKVSKTIVEREIRVLGPVVGWRDSKVTTVRSLAKPGKLTLHIEASRAAAEKRAAAACEKQEVVWGVRPADDEPVDSKAHTAALEKIIESGDIAAFKAYRKKYEGAGLLVTRAQGGVTRQYGYRAFDVNSLIQHVARTTNNPELMKLVVADKPEKPYFFFAAEGAIESGNTKHLALLLPLIQSIDEESFSDTLLARAVRLGRGDAVAALLKAGADPNHVYSTFGIDQKFPISPKDGNGPMVNAVRNGDTKILEQLLAAGGDPHTKTDANRRLIDFAKELGNKDIPKLLTAKGGKAPPMDMDEAVAAGNIERVLELVRKDGAEDALRCCCNQNKPDVLRAVLGSKATMDPAVLARDIWFAAGNGYEDCVAALLEHGADPNIPFGPYKTTALKQAQEREHASIVAMLKKAGAKVRVTKK